MKHIFKRALALTMIAVLFAVSAFAAPTFSNVAYDKTSGNLTVNVDGYTGGKDATILVLKAGVTPAEAKNNDIVFIDQVTVGEGKTVADYVAPIKVRANAVGAAGVNVWVGGDEITTAVPYTKAGETGATEISLADGPAPSEPTYAVEFDKTAAYKTLEAAKGAVKVKKTLAGTVSYLTAGEFTVTETGTATNVYTFTVKVGDKVVGTVEGVTITPDVTPGGKTGITGVVKVAIETEKEVVPYALVLVTKQGDRNIVAATTTNADGEFAVEGLAAGSYRVVVKGMSLTKNGATSYPDKVLKNIAVTEGNMVAAISDADCILLVESIEGDINGDGKVDIEDYNTLVQNFGLGN